MKRHFPSLLLAFLMLAPALYAQAPAVLTAEYDNGRTTANNKESLLSPATVNSATFGRIGSYAVDGQVTGQPLYVPGVNIGGKVVNVLYVGTMNNTLYALDADHPGAAPFWQVNFGPPVPAYYTGDCPAKFATGDALGILSTPVIDLTGKTIYVVSASPVANQKTYLHTLHALDIRNGQPRHGGSVVINAAVPGEGSGSVNGVVTMNQFNLIQRPALLLSNQTVYLGFSGCGPDPSPYHGWILGYRAGNLLHAPYVFNTTPNGDEGGVWQAGRGLVGNKQGSVYFETGNGTTDGKTDFGESIVKLTQNLAVQDWFTPSDYSNLSVLDLDLSTTSPLLTPDTGLIIGAGKEGVVYVLRAASLGGLTNPLQSFFGSEACVAVKGNACHRIVSFAYWANTAAPRLYVWGAGGRLHAFRYEKGAFVTTPDSQGTQVLGYPGGILAVTSAAGAPATGILWALTPGQLHAFNATDVSIELWNSGQNVARDALAGNYHLGQFTVVAGKVYVPDAQNNIAVYGLLPK